MKDNRLDDLIDVHLNHAMDGDQRRELEDRLLHSASDRERFWVLAHTHTLLHEGLQQSGSNVEHRPPAVSRFAWLRWQPFTTAAGIVVGLLCGMMAWAIASPGAVATESRLVTLVDGSFEARIGRLPSGFPPTPGIWSGDESEIVEAGDAKPHDGHRLLRFIRAEGERNAPDNPAESCDIFQVVDLRSLRTGSQKPDDSVLELSAQFLDARSVASEPVRMACHIYLFDGDPEPLRSVWPLNLRDALGSGVGQITSWGGPEAGRWRKVSARCVMPPNATLAVVHVGCGRVPGRIGSPPVLGAQFADDVRLTLITQPQLPIRILQR